MQGTLFKYASKQGNCAFRTGASCRCCCTGDQQKVAVIRYHVPIDEPACTLLRIHQGSHQRHLVLVGGLGDAFLFAPYIPLLAARLNNIGWYVFLLVTTGPFSQ